MKFVGIIPARYASTRFPAKVLAMLNAGLDKPLTAENYPKDEKWLIAKRNEINRMLAEQV